MGKLLSIHLYYNIFRLNFQVFNIYNVVFKSKNKIIAFCHIALLEIEKHKNTYVKHYNVLSL